MGLGQKALRTHWRVGFDPKGCWESLKAGCHDPLCTYFLPSLFYCDKIHITELTILAILKCAIQ